MKSYSFRLVLLLSFLLIVGGVNAQDEATEEPAPFVESPTVAPSATLEPTATLMPTNTPTLAPTATLVPTLTPTIEPTATLVPTDTPTLEPTNTLEPTTTPAPTEEITEEPTIEATPEVTDEPPVQVTSEPTAEVTAEPPVAKSRRARTQEQEQVQPQAEVTIVVNSTADPGDGTCDDTECTLREAIVLANSNNGTEKIHFDIPGGGTPTIQVQTPLPAIMSGVIIDGTTQPGYAGAPIVILDGLLLDPPTREEKIGLNFAAGGNSVLRGMVIAHFDWIGVQISGGAAGVTIEGNYIGVAPDGITKLPNIFGVMIMNASYNLVGGTTAAARNIISGNDDDAVRVEGLSANNNVIEGNYIGVDVTGTAISNNDDDGIRIAYGHGTIVRNNVISACTIGYNDSGIGVNIVSAANTTVEDNIIGLDVTGTVDMGNAGHGVMVVGSQITTLTNNTIAGGEQYGVYILDSSDTTLQNNKIGLDVSGENIVANALSGVKVESSTTTTLTGNTISGNTSYGVELVDSSGTSIQSNYIGTNAAGDTAKPNGSDGISIENSSNVTVSSNVISGNTVNGVTVRSGDVTGGLISGNLIGLNAAGTAVIANQGDGVSVINEGASSTNITANRIYGNTGLGINLGTAGVTADDTGDADTGPNGLQNFPALSGASVTAGGDLLVTGQLDTAASTAYRVEFFANAACDPSGYGEGQTYVGFANITTGADGLASISAYISGTSVAVGQFITATATDPNGSTSEFSACVEAIESINKPPVADAGVPQTVQDTDGSGSEDITLDGSASFDPDGTIDSYVWTDDLDQVIATGVMPTVSLPVGTHHIKLTITDNGGATAFDTVTITVNPQEPTCASITFTEFDSFGVAEFTVENPLTTPVLLDAFNIRWIQRAPGTMTLDQVTVGGTGPSDGATTVIWQSGAAGEDSTPPTYARSESSLGEGTWLTNYSFPGSSTTPLYLDFGGTDSALDAAFGVSAADFNGSEFQLDCGDAVNKPPIADAGTDQTVTDSDGNGYESVNLHGSASFDSDGMIVSYTWRDSANQVVATGVNPTVQLAVGAWDLTLTVVDDDGSEDVDTVTITVEAVSQTYVVNTTADPGDGTCDAAECTLREALNASNANEPKDTIAFDIPGTAPYIIAPETGMPEITDPVIIDGTTESDYVDAPIIVLTGGSLLDADGVIGLNISAGDSIVRGLVINFFSDSAGIRLTTNGGNVIEGNYIGLAADGVTAQGNFVGIDIADAPGNSIGGAALANRNVIAGNDDAGLKITGSTSTGNRVQGNYIGVDVTGAAPVLNGEALNLSTSSLTTIGTDGDGTDDVAEGNVILGVSFLSGSSSNVIAGNLFGTDSTGTVDLAGGTLGLYLDAGSANNRIGTNGDLISDSAEANVIAGYDTGVTLLGATTTGNTIAGNAIGTDVTGLQNLGNTLQGILIDSDASNTVVTGNTIRFNGVGIKVVTGTGNHFSGNVIADQTGLGINLDEDGNAATIDAVTANDVGDADTGANNLQNFPELTSAVIGGGDVTLAGTLNSTANTQFRIEFFANDACDASGYGEGETYLGFAEVTTNSSGNALIDETLTASVSLGQFITATATDPGGNTSEFSACVEVEAGSLTAPTDLIASAESGTTIGLSWTDTSSDETGFSVERSLNGSDGWTEIGTTAADVDTYIDEGLTCETAYFYRVRAVRDSDVSDYSNTDSATTLSCLEIALRTPRDGSATTSTRPNFRWQRHRDADRYRFELATDEDFTNLVLFSETPNNRRISYRVPRSDALSYGVYYWRVLADSGSGSFVPASEVRMLTVTPRLPRPPRQADPRNNARLNDPTPTLSWEAVSGAGDPFTYEIEIDDDARFRSPEISASVDGLSYSPASDLADGRWYWRVRAVNNLEVETRWSGRRSFIVDTVSPEAPQLQRPDEGSSSRNTRPVLRWKSVREAKEYRIQVSVSSDFTTPLLEVQTRRVSYRIPRRDALAAGTYYWQVQARDAAGNWGTFSTPFSFTVE